MSATPPTRNQTPAPGRKPGWLKVALPSGEEHVRLKKLARGLGIHTVCEEARCPNLGECWSGAHSTMTIMVLGDECTRMCRFCGVRTEARPAPPDPGEPERVAEAVAGLDVAYVVLTSVDRDDLPDGGAAHFAACIEAVRRARPGIVIEALIPDYTGDELATLLRARPDVLAHNVEVVPRLQRKVRDPRCSYERSLQTLREAKERVPGITTKSSLMLGLGETHEEVVEALRLLREADVDFLTLGQYLRPGSRNAPVVAYVEPEQFRSYQELGEEMGFRHVASGPLVRSSYRAAEHFYLASRADAETSWETP